MQSGEPPYLISDVALRSVTVSRREIDTALIGAIVGVGGFVVLSMSLGFDVVAAQAMAGKFLGLSAPLFAAAVLFLLWVAGALIVEIAGLTDLRRRWGGIGSALYYIENAAPFVGLLECFISIVKALLAYSEAGGSAAAQSVLIANIAVALGASAVGCFVALCAHSLKAVISGREQDVVRTP